VTDEHGCTDSTSKTVNINPLPNTDAKPDSLICVGSSIQLNVTGADTYLWNTSQSLSCTNCNNPVASPPDNTIYTVTGTNQFGCSSKDSVLVRVQHHLPLQISPNDSICLGQSVQLIASGSQLYSWNPSNGLNNSSISSPRASPTTSTQYTVTAHDSANCFTDTASVYVTVFPIPTVDAGPNDTIDVGSNVQLHATGSSDIISWKWTPGFGLSCIDCPNPTATPKETTEYTVEVRNEGQCPANDHLTIYVVCNKGNLFIPNTFSPNGDGINDRFYPRGQGVFLIKSFRVFDRWGEMVFEKLNFNPNDPGAGWDGTFKGKLLSPDVYVYTCEILCENNQPLSYKGDVTLLR
jgi:gliding motility-associated-like protein